MTSQDPAVARWIQRTLAADPPRAKSLIVTVWGDALAPHGGSVWLAGLIRLMAPLAINERLVRTSVFRLARDGWLAASTHGRRSQYRLTAQGATRFDEAYRRIYTRPIEVWNGTWELVLTDPMASARRMLLRDELAWSGYGQLNATTFIRPLQQSDGQLPALVRGEPRDRAIRMLANDVESGRSLASIVGRAWDLRGLAAEYRRFLKRFGGMIERFREAGEHDPAQCFVVRTMLIHAYRRVLLRDPLLPAALLPLDWPGGAAYVLCRDFYRLTHRSAERHLAETLASDGEDFPPADDAFYARFGGLDRSL